MKILIILLFALCSGFLIRKLLVFSSSLSKEKLINLFKSKGLIYKSHKKIAKKEFNKEDGLMKYEQGLLYHFINTIFIHYVAFGYDEKTEIKKKVFLIHLRPYSFVRKGVIHISKIKKDL